MDNTISSVSDHNFPSVLMGQLIHEAGTGRGEPLDYECDLTSWEPFLSRGFCIHGTGTVMQPASPRGVDEVMGAEH